MRPKPNPFLTFQRNRFEGWYEFALYTEPFIGGVIEKNWTKDGKKRDGWVVLLHTTEHALFKGSLNECKRFVRLMWESVR